MASYHGLESCGEIWVESEEGLCQGDPTAVPFFCVAWHKFVRKLDAVLAEVGGLARFGNDDGYLIGPASVVFSALDRFAPQVREHCLLRFQVTKTKVFS